MARVEQYSTTLSGETITGQTLLSTERYYYDTVNRLTCTRVSDSDGEHVFRWTYDSNNTSVSGKRYGALKKLRSGCFDTRIGAYNTRQNRPQKVPIFGLLATASTKSWDCITCTAVTTTPRSAGSSTRMILGHLEQMVEFSATICFHIARTARC